MMRAVAMHSTLKPDFRLRVDTYTTHKHTGTHTHTLTHTPPPKDTNPEVPIVAQQ